MKVSDERLQGLINDVSIDSYFRNIYRELLAARKVVEEYRARCGSSNALAEYYKVTG